MSRELCLMNQISNNMMAPGLQGVTRRLQANEPSSKKLLPFGATTFCALGDSACLVVMTFSLIMP